MLVGKNKSDVLKFIPRAAKKELLNLYGVINN